MSETAICLDQRHPQPVSEPHGPWWLTIRLPLIGRRHLYLAAATGRQWTGRSPWLRVALPKVATSPSLSLHRWCGHINVRYEKSTREPNKVTHEVGADGWSVADLD